MSGGKLWFDWEILLFFIFSGLTKDQDPSNNEYTLPVAVKFEADLNIIG